MDGDGAAGFVHGDGHQTEPGAAVPVVGRSAVEAVAVVGDAQSDAVVVGGEPDGDFGGLGARGSPLPENMPLSGFSPACFRTGLYLIFRQAMGGQGRGHVALAVHEGRL